jgi:hypothetical protein
MDWFKNVFQKVRKKTAPDYYRIPETERMEIIERSCKQVSRGVFFSTIIIISSFLPVSSAGIHQNIHPYGGCRVGGNACPGIDFIFYERKIQGRKC